MATREILSKNLYTLMKESPRFAHLSTIQKIVVASGGKLANGTVGRMTKGDAPTDVDRLGELAEVFGLQAWQLLVPDIKANTVPVLADSTYLDNIREIVKSIDAAQATPHATRSAAPKFTDKHKQVLDQHAPTRKQSARREQKK